MKFGDIKLICLDPTVGAEMKKTRPCIVISPDEMNTALKTVIVAPITSKKREIPTRILIKANVESGLILDSFAALGQIKTIDKARVVKDLGIASEIEKCRISDTLCVMFAY